MSAHGSVGRYRLQEVIGVGSFATVHRAVDERLDATVVVKILAENHSLNPEVRERFIAEGRALRKVRSSHVVTAHDLGESDRQQPYLVLEYADRGTLAQRVDGLRGAGWTATTEDVAAVVDHLGAALRAVHAAHLVHRDLSPANVLVATDPERTGALGVVRVQYLPEGTSPADVSCSVDDALVQETLQALRRETLDVLQRPDGLSWVPDQILWAPRGLYLVRPLTRGGWLLRTALRDAERIVRQVQRRAARQAAAA